MSVQLYKFEPFSFEIQTANPISNVATSTNLIPYVTRVDPSAVLIRSSNGYLGAPSSNESVVVTDVCGTVIQSNYSLNAGRFFDGSGQSFNNRSFGFFKNETITPILFDSCINLALIQSVPTLPPGLSFISNSPTSFLLQGTPVVQIPSSNYLVIGTGTNPSQIVTTRVFGLASSNGGVNIGVGAERIQVDVSGSSIVSPMVVNTPISIRTITSRLPAPSSANVQYSWSTLPDGIRFSNKNGTPYLNTSASISGGVDPSFTLVLNGTPTLDAAKSFAFAGLSNYTVPIQVFRTSPLPILSNTTAITFQFEPMVLFDSFSIPQLYAGVEVPSNLSFRAKTYFTTDASITSITQTGFPAGVDVSFVAVQQRAYLVGTPATTGTFAGTLFASTGSLVGSNPVTLSVSNDVITFVSPTATSNVSFIVSRPLTSFKDGYYTSNIQFKAVASSGRNIVYGVDGIFGTGIGVNIANGIVTLTGIPTSSQSAGPLTVTASAGSSSASTSIQYEIVNDQLTFAPIPLSNREFIQNRRITPIQLQVSTLSERPVISFNGSNVPASLQVSPTGLISGQVSSSSNGTFQVSASTGFVSATQDISYTIIPDSILMLAPASVIPLTPGETIDPIQIQGLSYGGATVSNYQFSNLSPTYGMTINATTGLITGTLFSGLPPTVLPSTSNFSITGDAGSLSGELQSSLITCNAYVNTTFIPVAYRGLYTSSSATPNDITTQFRIEDSNISYYMRKNNSVDSNVHLVTNSSTTAYRSQFGNVFQTVGIDTSVFLETTGITGILNKPGTSTWWALGFSNAVPYNTSILYQSVDDGLTWQKAKVGIMANDTVFYLRNLNGANPGTNYPLTNPYIRSGALGYISSLDRLLAGGIYDIDNYPGIYSDNGGETWNNANIFIREVAYINTDDPSLIIATGTDTNKSFVDPYELNSFTSSPCIRWSSNGTQWSNVTWDTAQTFNVIGGEIAYANNTWIATGVFNKSSDPSDRFSVGVAYSSNGSNWSMFDLSSNTLFPSKQGRDISPLPIGSIYFDGSNWNIPVSRSVSGSFVQEVYIHDSNTTTFTDPTTWTKKNLILPNVESGVQTKFLPTKPPLYLTSTPFNVSNVDELLPIQSFLVFSTVTAGGPTFLSPTSSNVLFYQYLPITPIQIQASGTGQIYYFLESADLPRGLSFDPLTATISGTSVVLGDNPIRIYARDDNGTSVFTLYTTTVVPRIVKKQESAGAYTSLVRQYTEVNAAQSAVNNLVYPNQEQKLGEFMAPNAPDVVKDKVDPKCFNPDSCF